MPATSLHLTSEFTPLRLEIDSATGLPSALRRDGRRIPVSTDWTLTLGGSDERGPVGELVYRDAITVSTPRRTGEPVSRIVRDGRLFAVPVELGGWTAELRYTLGADSPALTWTWELRPTEEALDLRGLEVRMCIGLDDEHEEWSITAPGNRLRAAVPWRDLPATGEPPITISSIGGSLGSTGVIAATSTASRQNGGAVTAIVWPRSRDENGVTLLSRDDDGIVLTHTTGLATAADPATAVLVDGIAADLLPERWETVRDRIPGWFDALGIATPRDRPDWTRGATLFEAQVGTSIFAGGTWTYSPYPELADLVADVPRIADLGFDTIQLMPRQPFPSYNVIDYDDVDTTYGSEADLRRLVEVCHARGMRVILDVLLHGVIDQESITSAADTVRRGPWGALTAATQDELDALALPAADFNRVTWSRHILDFEAAWRDGSPAVHPLTLEHPEWFCRDSEGRIIGIYTKAFDMANPDWQEYFTGRIVSLVERLGIDGFRFDAPGYNQFPNWSPRTRTRASLQQLGAVGLFRRLRRVLRERYPDLMLYTEENGALWRQYVDLNYNYDEFWLLDSLVGTGGDAPAARVRHGRDLAEWLEDRDRTLPAGAVTAHHIDSHDTFWFLLPGRKWRREQFGLDATRALLHVFALSGGPYMMFVGGEEGLVDDVRAVNRLRHDRAELVDGPTVHGEPRAAADALYTVRHGDGADLSILAVNLSPEAVTSILEGAPPGPWRDLLSDEVVDLATSVQWAPFQSRFLVRDGSALA